MRPRLVIALSALVIGPVAALTALGVKITRDERKMSRRRHEDLLRERLEVIRGHLEQLLLERERELEVLTALPDLDPRTIYRRMRESPYVEQMFVQNAAGEILFPPLSSLTSSDRAFLRRTRHLWTQRDAFTVPAESAVPLPGSGWYTWYRDNGLGLIFWRRDTHGRTVGAELGRIRLLADLVAELPATGATGESHSRTVLVDARGHAVYQWGAYEPGVEESARVQVALAEPLSTWKLYQFVPAAHFDGQLGGRTRVALVAGIIALALALAWLALYLYREGTRQIREAEQRVSFVNQVSHELKTPLTNIRMYAEMLEGEVEESDRGRRYLGVIVSESQRLSRLIGNVLTFARQRRGVLKVRRQPGGVDEVVEDTLAQFAPSLMQKGIEVTVEGSAPGRVELDRDIVAQILANLISNVEKYAAAGKQMRVELTQDGDQTQIRVRDAGPGIPAARARAIFEPFVRLRNDVTEGTSGAGIGLGLARDLARLHGGDLVWVPTEAGTCMQLTLHTPQVTP